MNGTDARRAIPAWAGAASIVGFLVFSLAACSFETARAAEAEPAVRPIEPIPLPPQAGKFLQDADRSLNAGNLDLALIQLKSAVRLAPENGAARAKLGLALLRAGAAVTAARELRQAWRDGAPDEIVVPGILQTLLVRGKPEELLVEFPDPPADTQSKAAADILIARARSLQILGRAGEAKAAMERALKLRRDPQVLVARANLAAEQNDMALARRLADEAVKLAPESDGVLMLTVSLLRREGKPEEALGQTDRFLAGSPQDFMAKALRVEILLELKRDAEAKSDVDEILKESKNFTLGTYYRALLAARAGDAKGAWQVAQNLQPEFVLLQPDIAMTVAQMATASGNLETGAAILAGLVSRHPDLAPARIQLARVQLILGNPDTALKTLSPVRDSGDPEVQALMGQAYLQLHRFSEAIVALENATATGTVGGGELLKRQLALSALEYGDTDRAMDELQQLLARDPENWAVAAPLIVSLVTAGRFDDALGAADRMAKQGDKTPLAPFYRGQVLAVQGDLSGASAAFGEALGIDGTFLPALYFRARVSLARGNPETAREDFRKILDQSPGNVSAYLGLAQIALNEDREPEFFDLLAQAAKAAPGDPAPRLALANYQMARGKFDEALSTLNALLRVVPDDPESLALLGRLQFAMGERDRAVDTFRSIAASNTRSPGAYELLAKALNATNDRLAAIDAAKKAAELAPYSARLHAMLAEFQIVAGRPENALATAKDFRSAHPGAVADLLLGDTLIRLKRVDEARSFLAERHAAKPDRLLALRLSQLAMSHGDLKEAIAVLARWLKAYPRDFDVRREYGSLLLQTGDRSGARREFEILLKQRPEDPVVLNNLGRSLQDENIARSLALLSLAARITPRSPTILDTLGWLKHRADDDEGALPLIRRAHDLTANNGEIEYHLALVLDATGKHAEAKAVLQSLLSRNLKFGAAAEARQLLAHW